MEPGENNKEAVEAQKAMEKLSSYVVLIKERLYDLNREVCNEKKLKINNSLKYADKTSAAFWSNENNSSEQYVKILLSAIFFQPNIQAKLLKTKLR